MPPALPTRPLDIYTSSSTGHQVSESRNPPGWRASRNAKLQSQFLSGPTGSGGPRIPDTVGPNAGTYDPTLNALVTPAARARATNSVADMLLNPGTMNAAAPAPPPPPKSRGIFDGCTVYINGLTGTAAPISDLRLKQELAKYGADVVQNLARRDVTHVIVGRPNAGPGGRGGAGGALSAKKLEGEIKTRKAAVKFVGAEWVLESITARKRLPESRFENIRVAAARQRGIQGFVVRPRGGGGDGSAQE
ncbi:hypothetical protein QBC39DRAFT_288113 [Podospora conica]|nr:hypothetical protein QBC39DRAFT_288113 [Schizothecium conicum]